jgi:hypothetical protein
MEIMIDLSGVELDAVAGGSGTASFRVTDTASGTTAAVAARGGEIGARAVSIGSMPGSRAQSYYNID